MKMLSQMFDKNSQLCLKCYLRQKKSLFYIVLEKTFFCKVHLRFVFKNMRPHFQNRFVPIFFYVFCARLKDWTQISYWKPNTSVLLSTSWTLQFFSHYWAFLLLCGPVSNIFTMFFRGSEVCLERYDSYGDFGY